MSNNLKIPENERHKFSQPLGKLYSGTREETLPLVIQKLKQEHQKNTIKCYLVGDIVTKDFLKDDFLKSITQLCVIDEKTKRAHIEMKDEPFFEQVVEFQNPEGSINPESFDLFDSIIKSNKKTLLKITVGEEDLLVLPLVVSIPLSKSVKHYVFYGQPPVTDSKTPIPEGIVMVEINKYIHKIVKTYLNLMSKS